MSCPTPRPHPNSVRVLAATAGALIGLAGCGGGDPKPGPEVAGGNAGIDETVGADLKVLDVEIEYPVDGQYRAGDDASLYVAISNTGSSPDTLIDVAGPDFADVQGDGDGDEVSIPVPGSDTVFVGAEDEPTLTLVDLGRSLRSSESLPVTFVFEQAGAVTVDAVVAAEGQHPRSDVDFPNPAEDPTGQG
jgi:periplasmic copper chaperone A